MSRQNLICLCLPLFNNDLEFKTMASCCKWSGLLSITEVLEGETCKSSSIFVHISNISPVFTHISCDVHPIILLNNSFIADGQHSKHVLSISVSYFCGSTVGIL